MIRNEIESDFRTSKMATPRPHRAREMGYHRRGNPAGSAGHVLPSSHYISPRSRRGRELYRLRRHRPYGGIPLHIQDAHWGHLPRWPNHSSRPHPPLRHTHAAPKRNHLTSTHLQRRGRPHRHVSCRHHTAAIWSRMFMSFFFSRSEAPQTWKALGIWGPSSSVGATRRLSPSRRASPKNSLPPSGVRCVTIIDGPGG